MYLIITSTANGYNYSVIETKGYNLIDSGCGLTCKELIKAIAQIDAVIHENSRSIYNQAIMTHVNRQFQQAYS